MTMTDLLTFEKNLSADARVRIHNIPGSIRPGGEHDRSRQLIEPQTYRRLEHLMKVARRRMAGGETDIRIDYADDV